MRISFYFFIFCSYFTSYSQEFFDTDKIESGKQIEELNTIILQDPSAENYYYRGYNNYISENYPEALSDYNKALSLAPNDFNIYFSRGNLNIKLKDYEGAIADFSKCISLDKNSQKSYFNRAFAERKIYNRTGAIDDYSKSIALNLIIIYQPIKIGDY